MFPSGSNHLASQSSPFGFAPIGRYSNQHDRLSSSSSKVTTTLTGHSTTKKLQNELFQLITTPTLGVSAFPESEKDLSKWIGTIEGIENTPYEGLSYKISIQFPIDYPYEPPIIRFNKFAMFHPNVDKNGNICLDILKHNWSPIFNIRTILLSLQSLLGEPNTESPMNIEAAKLWGRDGNNTVFRKAVLYHHKFELEQRKYES